MAGLSDDQIKALAEAMSARSAFAPSPSYTAEQRAEIKALIETGRTEDLVAAQRIILSEIQRQRGELN